MSLVYSGAEPQPSLAWQFESSNVDYVTNLTPSAQVSPGPAQLVGGASLVTTVAGVSNTAVYFPGDGHMYLGLSGTFNTTTSNCFVECWVYFNDISINNYIYTIANTPATGTSVIFRLAAINNQVRFNYNNTSGSINGPTTIQTGRWYHIAVSSVPTGTSYCFIDGVPGTGASLIVPTYVAYAARLGVSSGDSANMYIRDLRVVQGGVVPVATFTPLASAPFSYASPTYVANMGTTVFTLLGQFITYVPGKYGSSLVLLNPKVGGSSNVANTTVAWTTSTSSNAMTGVTVSYWINFYSIPPNDVNLRSLIFKYGSLYTTNYGTNLLQGMYDGSGYPGAVNTFNPTIGTWYHLTQVYGSGLITSYVNGSSLPNKGNFTTALTDSNPVLRIASDSFLDFPSSFQIDDLRIYNTALTAAQVQSVYSSQGAPAPSRAMPLPKLAWDFNGTTADYVSGLSAITPTQLSGFTSFMITTAPTSNTAAYFPGNASHRLTAAGPLNNLNLTTTNVFAESLVYMNSLTASPSIILSKGQKTNPADWWFGINNTGTFQATVTNTGGTPFTASTSLNLATGSWNHVAFSYVASTKVIYVWLNGANQGSATLTGTANNYASFGTWMAWDGGSQYANMYVRDIRVVSGGIAPISTTFTPTTAPWGLNQAAYVTGMGTSIYAFPSQTINYTPGIYGQAIVLTNPLNSAAHPNNYVTWTLSPLLGSTTTAYGYTVAFWFKPTSTLGFQQVLDISGFNGDGDWRFELIGGKIQFYYLINNSATTTTYQGVISTVNYTVNGWNHAAVSLYESATGTSICFYLNNILQGTLTSQWGSLRTFSKLGIGSFPTGQTYPYPYDGQVDDLRIFDRALTSAQVQSIYNQQGVPGRGVTSKVVPTFTVSDQSQSPLTLSTYGSATSNTNSPFGGTEGSFQWTATIPSSVSKMNFNFWSSNSFVEFWWNAPANLPSGYPRVFQRGNYPNEEFSIYQAPNSSSLFFQFSNNSTYTFPYTPNTYQPGIWNHYAVSFNPTNSTLYIGINGTIVYNSVIPLTSIPTYNSSSNWFVCNGSQIPSVNIQISNFRMVTGAATLPYITNGFTVPTAPLSVYPTGTTALLLRSVSPLTMFSGGAIQSATGGDTVQDIGGYRIHTFTTVGTSTFTPASAGNVEVLVVAGGGSGGTRHAGGGGAGGLIYNSSFPVSGAVSVTVGDGGAGLPQGTNASVPGNSGANSVFGSLTAIGGGYGNQGNGGSGGSGGGVFSTNTVGAGTAGQGNNGAFGSTGPFSTENTYAGGGGGGAGAVGTAATSVAPVQGGAGGIGRQISISGTPTYYAGGGGGGTTTAVGGGAGGAGGLGGGGAGGGSNSIVGIAGTNGTGGGGGCGGFSNAGGNFASGKGGSGIVIVRYPLPIRLTGTPLFTQLSPSATSSAVGAFSLRAVNGTSARAVAVIKGTLDYSSPPLAVSFTGSAARSSVVSNVTQASMYFPGNLGSYLTFTDSRFATNFKPTKMTFETWVNYPNFTNCYYSPFDIPLSFGTMDPVSNPAAWTFGPNTTGYLVFYYWNGTFQKIISTTNPLNTNTWYHIAVQSDGTNIYIYVNGVLIKQDAISGTPSTLNMFTIGQYNTYNNAGVIANFYVGDTRLVYGANPYATAGFTAPSAPLAPYTTGGATTALLLQTPSLSQDFYADRLGNLLTAPVVGQRLANWLGGATGYVTKWYDQSGRGNDAIQNTAAAQPIIQRATKGPGYMCVFSGAQSLSSSTLSLYNTPYSFALTERSTSTGTVTFSVNRNPVFSYSGGTVSTNGSLYYGRISTGSQYALDQVANSLDPPSVTAFTNSVSEPLRYHYGMKSAASAWKKYIYNDPLGPLTATNTDTVLVSSNTGKTFNIGYLYLDTGVTNYYYGEIYELLVFTQSLYDLDNTGGLITQVYQNQLGAYGT